MVSVFSAGYVTNLPPLLATSAGILPWADQDDDLQRFWLAGLDVPAISALLGRSPSAVLTRAARLNLPRRTKPGRKSATGAATTMATAKRVAPKIKGFMPSERIRKIVNSNQNNQISKKPVIVYESRMCLCCGSSFASEGSHNRICSKCKESQRYRNAS